MADVIHRLCVLFMCLMTATAFGQIVLEPDPGEKKIAIYSPDDGETIRPNTGAIACHGEILDADYYGLTVEVYAYELDGMGEIVGENHISSASTSSSSATGLWSGADLPAPVGGWPEGKQVKVEASIVGAGNPPLMVANGSDSVTIAIGTE